MATVFNQPTSLYEKKGTRAVLLLHAFSGSPNDVRMLARALGRANYTVYAPLFSGHGSLDVSDILSKSPRVWLEDVREAQYFLQNQGFREAAVFGLSMGGIYALNALIEAPAYFIGGGAFCSPVFANRKNNIVPSFLRYSKKVQSYTGENLATVEEKIIKEKVQATLRDIQVFSNQTGQRLAEIKQPVFLAQGGADQMIDPNSVNDTAAAITSAKEKVIKWYPEAGHVITVGASHHELEKDVLDFLAKLAWTEVNYDNN